MEKEWQPGWYFTGRITALSELVQWLTAPQPDGKARVVTGGPGSGKSAVLARLVTLSNPEYRKRVPLEGIPGETIPPEGRIDLAIHARGKTLKDCLASIAEMAGIKATQPDLLIHELARQGKRWVILLDAIDEASDPHEIARKLLRPLSSVPTVQLLVGTRRDGIVPALEPSIVVIDLDKPEYANRADIAEYVKRRLLAEGDPTRPTPYRGKAELAGQVAKAVSEKAYPVFLVARLISQTLIEAAEPVNISQPEWRKQFPSTVGDAFEEYLDRFGADKQRVCNLLRPLAYSEGAGLPWEDIWAPLASAIAGVHYTDSDIEWVLKHAGAYIAEGSEAGRSVYRLYHQALADHLRLKPQNAEIQRRFTNTLIEHTPDQISVAGKDWLRASPYVRRHLAAHAASAGMLDALIGDPEFVLACDLGRLLTVLDQACTEEGRTTADVIVSAASYLEPRRLDSASYLQMFARRYGAATFADRVGRGHPLPWSTRWRHVMPRTPHRVLGYHDGAATAITSLVLPDAGQVAVSGGADGFVRVWNLKPGGSVHEPWDIGTPVRSIRPMPRRDGHPGVLLLDQAGTCTWWGLTRSPALPLNLNGQKTCHCTAIRERNGTATALLGCGRTIVEYDIECDCAVRTIDLTSCYSGRPVQVSGIAVLSSPEGDGLLVADLSGSAIAVVDLTSGDTVGTLTTPGDENGAMGSLLAAAHVGGRRVAMVKGRRDDIQLWDLDSRTLIGYTMMQGICGSGTMSDGRPIVFATDMDGMFGAWDLSDLVASCSQQQADDLTDQIFKAILALPAGPEEGSATLRNGPETTSRFHTDWGTAR